MNSLTTENPLRDPRLSLLTTTTTTINETSSVIDPIQQQQQQQQQTEQQQTEEQQTEEEEKQQQQQIEEKQEQQIEEKQQKIEEEQQKIEEEQPFPSSEHTTNQEPQIDSSLGNNSHHPIQSQTELSVDPLSINHNHNSEPSHHTSLTQPEQDQNHPESNSSNDIQSIHVQDTIQINSPSQTSNQPIQNVLPNSDPSSDSVPNLQTQPISSNTISLPHSPTINPSLSISSDHLTLPQKSEIELDPSHSPNHQADHETVRSREMSLSVDSNPDQSNPPVSQPISSTFLTDVPPDSKANQSTTHQILNPSEPSTAPSDNNNNLNHESPITATSLKFPLPAKPPHQQLEQNQPLFAPSPTSSESLKPIQSSSSNIRQPPVLSRLASLKQRVEKDPMDGEAWIELISDAEKKGDLEKTREVYSSFLQNFPDAANQWIAYADLELGHGHFPEVEQIFSRCLRSSVSVELWAFYLNYIRRVNPVEGDKAAASRAIIISAYDFSLNHIGIDRESGQIWLDYINIVKAGEASGTWQEQQKMDSVRKLYQRAVCIPLDNIEQLWKDYDSFEHQMSKMTAKKFLADKSAQYMMARAGLKEMKTLTNCLLRPKVPVKPNWKRIDDHTQLDQWKAYLAWEEKNPLEISDKILLNTRIQYAYRQAIMHMRFHPEIWYLFANHLQKNDKTEEASTVIQAGLLANPTSIVLTYAMGELQENLKNYPACYAGFNSLVRHYHNEIDEINKTIEKEIAHGISFVEPASTGAGLADDEADQELTEEDAQRVKDEERLRTNITALYKPKIDELREAAASVWITEMRFARRTEGIKPARAAFTRARKAPYITRHVFEASAMMEYHWNKDSAVATKVFDLGLKTFSDDVDYVLQYLDFLITLNDDSNARALFEKTVSKIPPAQASPLWRRWAAYEFIYGDQAASEKLNSRIAEIFPDWGVVERLVDRHTYAGLRDVLGRELGTAIEPIPLRRSPTPTVPPADGYGAKRIGGGGNEGAHHPGIPSGPASYRNRPRDRSFSPDFRSKRARVPAPRGSVSPDCRNGSASEIPSAAPSSNTNHNNKRGRDNFDSNSKRNRFSSPPRSKIQTPPPAANAPGHQQQQSINHFAWFPDGLRYFLSILPSVISFEGPKLDSNTVIQVLSEANIPMNNNSNTSNMGTINTNQSIGEGGGGVYASSNNSNRGSSSIGRGDGFNNSNNSAPVPLGWGPNRGNLHGSSSSISSNNHPSRGNHSSGRRGRRK